MKTPLNSLLLILTFFCLKLTHAQCTFSTMKDTLLCSPSEINLTVSGSNLDRVSWEGPNIESSNKGKSIKAFVNKTSTYYVKNVKVDPENLIKNGDFELGNQDFDSDYYSSCVPERMPQGAYCIGNNSDDYWVTWRACRDRTNPGPGRFYITDGAIIPNEKIWCQTVPVKPNTDYSFSTYLTSVLNQENAILQFTINGSKIGENFEASPVECEWNQFYEYWNSGLNESARICITNQNTAADGNDFAIDDIAFNEICVSHDSVKVEVSESFNFSLNENPKVCPGKPLKLFADKNFNEGYNLTWSNGSKKDTISIISGGEYSLTVENKDGCTLEKKVDVIETTPPQTTLPQDTSNCFLANPELRLIAGKADWAIWEYNSIKDTSLILNIVSPGEYHIKLVNGLDCYASDRITINDSCSTQLFIPNSFTPNGDGINDDFGVVAVDAYNYKLEIYNRYGSVIFSSTNPFEKWNGHKANQGVYVYRLSYSLADPQSENLTPFIKVGTVSLLR